MKIQLKNSATYQSGAALPPSASQMEYGELAINYNSTDPALFIKDDTNNVIRIGGVGNISFTDYQAVIPISATGPGSPLQGNLYFDTDDNRLYIWDGAAWQDASQEKFDITLIPDTTNSASQSGTLDDRYALKAGDTFTGNLILNAGVNINSSDIYLNNGKIIFEGSSNNSFETELVVVNPTQDNVVTIPDTTGTLITTGDTGTVTSTMIADGTIVDADINSSAAISLSKLGTGSLPSGITVNSSNIVDGSIVDADISSSAAIDPAKLGAGTLPTNVTIPSSSVTVNAPDIGPGALHPSVQISSPNIAAGSIVDSDVSSIAEIQVSKLADGSARQLLQTDSAGTGVEWTSNIDIPGTLDVTSTAQFDAAVFVNGSFASFGTNFTINSDNVEIKDKNITINDVASPSDSNANGGGITLKGTTDKLITYDSSGTSWLFSENVDLANGKEYKINGQTILSATALHSSVVSSSLTSVGTIATGVWQGTPIADSYLATISTAGSVSNSATTATNLNSPNTIVSRDGSGDFSARNVTADLIGNASTASTLATSRTITLSGDVSGSASFDGSSDITISTSVVGGGLGQSGGTDLSYTGSTRELASSTGTNVTLPLFSSTEAGLTGASGGGTTNFLRADGTWAAPAGTGTTLGYTVSTRTVTSSTGGDVSLPLFTDYQAGLVAASGGGTTKFLRADGTWATLTSGGGGTDLTYTASTRVLASNTGSDTTLPEVVASGNSGLMTGADKAKLDGISGSGGNTDLSYTASTRELASSTGTNVTLPEVAAAGDSGLMTGADKTKLDGIATGAEVNAVTSVNGQTGAVTVAGNTDLSYTASTRELASSTGNNVTLPEVVAAGDSGLMTGSDKTKLNGIETGATADQTAAEIRTLVDAATDSNVFTDSEKADVAANKAALPSKANLVGGKLDTSELPDIAISEYKGSVANQTAMLAVTGEKGDWVTRSDDGKVYVITGSNPSQASDWTALSYPVAAGTDLSYTGSSRELASSTGSNVTLPEVTAGGDSGLMTGTDKTKLDDIDVSGASNGQALIYNSTSSTFEASDISAGFTVSSATPSSPSNGDTYYDTDDATSYIYVDDGNSSQWVPLSPTANSATNLTWDSSTGTLSSSTGNSVNLPNPEGITTTVGPTNTAATVTLPSPTSVTVESGHIGNWYIVTDGTYPLTVEIYPNYNGQMASAYSPSTEWNTFGNYIVGLTSGTLTFPGWTGPALTQITTPDTGYGQYTEYDQTGNSWDPGYIRFYIEYDATLAAWIDDGNNYPASEPEYSAGDTFSVISGPTVWTVTSGKAADLTYSDVKVNNVTYETSNIALSNGDLTATYSGVQYDSTLTAGDSIDQSHHISMSGPTKSVDFGNSTLVAGATTVSSLNANNISSKSFTASGAITSGKPVILNADGTVTQVGQSSFNTPNSLMELTLEGTDTTTGYSATVLKTPGQNYGDFWTFHSNNTDDQLVINRITVNGNTAAVGDTFLVNVTGGSASGLGSPAFSEGDDAIAFYADTSNNRQVMIAYGNENGIATSTVGSYTTWDSMKVCEIAANKGVVLIRDYSDSNKLKALVYDLTSGSLTFGTAVEVHASGNYFDICWDPDRSEILISYSASSKGYVVAGTVSGTTITLAPATELVSQYCLQTSIVYDTVSDNAVFFTYEYHFGFGAYILMARVLTTGSTPTVGSLTFVDDNGTDSRIDISVDTTNNLILTTYRATSGDGYYPKTTAGTISGTSITFDSAHTHHQGKCDYLTNAYHPYADKMLAVYNIEQEGDGAFADFASTTTLTTNLTADNYIGIAAEAIADTASGGINISGNVNTGQSSLNENDIYYVQGNGTFGTTPADPEVIAGRALTPTDLLIHVPAHRDTYKAKGIASDIFTVDTPMFEEINIISTPDFGNISNSDGDIDLEQGNVHYILDYETAGVQNPVNFRWNSSTTLGSKMAAGQSLSITLILATTDTSRAPDSIYEVHIDDTDVTTLWLGNAAPPTDDPGSAGKKDHDVYTFNVLKTSSGYTVLASKVRFGLN